MHVTLCTTYVSNAEFLRVTVMGYRNYLASVPGCTGDGTLPGGPTGFSS